MEKEGVVAYCFRIFHDLKLVYRRTWGVYDDIEMQGAHEQWRLLTSDSTTHYFDALMDLTDVSEYRVTAGAVRAQARLCELTWQAHDGGRIVRIAYLASKPNAFGTGRMVGALMNGNGVDLRVFDSLSEVGIWLGLSLARLELITAMDNTNTSETETRAEGKH